MVRAGDTDRRAPDCECINGYFYPCEVNMEEIIKVGNPEALDELIEVLEHTTEKKFDMNHPFFGADKTYKDYVEERDVKELEDNKCGSAACIAGY